MWYSPVVLIFDKCFSLEVNKNIYNDDKLKNIVNSVQQIIVSDFMNDVLS